MEEKKEEKKEEGEEEIRIEVIEDRRKFQEQRVPKIAEEFKLEKVVVELNKAGYRGVVALSPIDFTTKCEHHLVSIHGQVYFAYVPNDYLIGLSYVARVIEHFLNPSTEIIQEEVTKQIADFFENTLKPQGVWVVIKAKHDCYAARGIKQRNTYTITSEIRGCFWDYALRKEVMSLWKL